MKSILMLLCVALVWGTGNQANAQLPTAGPEYDVFKKDVGTWDTEIKFWGGPGEPEVTKGSEKTVMLGDFWLITDFQGNMMGMDFKGHGTYSFDPEKNQYIGSWIDSMGPTVMHMTGKYDKENETLTYVGMAPGEDGNPAKHTMATSYKGGKRVFTMHVEPEGGEAVKIMEVVYTKK